MGDANPIRTLRDYSKPSHEGYRNTIELLVEQRVPSFDPKAEHQLRMVQTDAHSTDFGSITTWEDLTTRFLAQFFPPGRIAKLHNDILMFQQHQDESLYDAWTCYKDLIRKWKTPTSTISDQTIANLKDQLVGNEVVRVKIPSCMSWLDAYDEPLGDLDMMEDKVKNQSPQSTQHVLSSFEVYTPPVTYLEAVEETLGTPIEEEPLDQTKLEDVGLTNHNISLSNREVSSFDEPKPQPNPLPNSPSLYVSLGEEKGPKPLIKPHSLDSFRMKEVDSLTINTPPSPHVTTFHPNDTYCYYHPCIDDPKKHYGFKPDLLGHSGSLSVDFLNFEMIEDDWRLESKEVSFLREGLNLPVWPNELKRSRAVDLKSAQVGLDSNSLCVTILRYRMAGDGVAGIKQRRRDQSSDGVKNMATASGCGRLKEDLESSTWRRLQYCKATPSLKIFYDHVNPATRRTINHSTGGKLHDRNAKESWALLEDLALYDKESWNDLRYFAKPVKVISLPQDVPSTSDHRLIELESQVQRLMEAHLTPKSSVQVNKITSSCKICSGPHDTQYCMENPKQAFVDYASLHINEAGDARLSKFEANFKQQQGEMTNKIDTFLKAINDRMTGALPSDMNDGGVMLIEIIKNYDDSSEEELGHVEGNFTYVLDFKEVMLRRGDRGFRDVGYGVGRLVVDPKRGSSRMVGLDITASRVELAAVSTYLWGTRMTLQDVRASDPILIMSYAHETYLQAHQTQLQRQEYSHSGHSHQSMRREMSDMQAELLALREQRRIARQSGPEARIPDHQEASGDADSHI
ncbi:ribonuclease H-like domain-containing protein [Tanacetum coccineum]